MTTIGPGSQNQIRDGKIVRIRAAFDPRAIIAGQSR
jgi:hypothetical protein